MEEYMRRCTQTIKERRDALYYMDVIRGIAAILVMAGHLRALFFVDFTRVNDRNILVRAIYFVTGFGHQAVMIFFVLSGFFIALNVWGALVEHRWSWRWYMTQRLTRLWIVLLPALLIGACWDGLGITFFGTKGIYAGLDPYILPYPVEPRLTVPIFLGNLFFLQNIRVSTFGSNDPLWSLANEFWYYLLFPCLVLVVYTASKVRRVLYVVTILAISVFVGQGIIAAFGLWLMGVIVTLVPLRPIKSRLLGYLMVGVTGILLLVSLIFVRLQLYVPADLEDWLIAAIFTLLVYTVLNIYTAQDIKGISNEPKSKRYSFIGGFSYTLYLTHMPLIAFLSAWNYDLTGSKWQPTFLLLLLGVSIGCGVIGYSWLIAYFTEARTAELRQLVRRYRGALLERYVA